MNYGDKVLLSRNEMLFNPKTDQTFHVHVLNFWFLILVNIKTSSKKYHRINTIKGYVRLKDHKNRYCMHCKTIHPVDSFYKDCDVCLKYVNNQVSYDSYMKSNVFYYGK